MDVMVDNDEIRRIASCDVDCSKLLVDGGLRVVNQTRGVVEIILAVNIVVYYVITHVRKHILGGIVAFRVRWPHVSWEESQDIAECHLIIVHLVLLLLDSHVRQVLMCPSVARDLVARFMHSLKELWVASGNIIYLTLPHIVSRDEKRRFRIVFIEDIKNHLCIDIRAIVKSQSYVALVCAVVDSSSSVAEIPYVRPSNIFGRVSRRLDVSIAFVSVAELTSWPRAVMEILATESAN